jgi:tryptophanase
MSDQQWAGMMGGDESYAGASSYYRLRDAATELFGCGFVQPVHQGRGAEKVLMPILLGPGKFAVSNMFFDTTRAHVELAGGRAVDCVTAAAKDPAKRVPFKGNMDVAKMEEVIREKGAAQIGLVVMTLTNNSAGGQPVSMANLREVAASCKSHGIPLVIDGARYAENAYFIKRDETGYQDKTIREIIREMFKCCDYFTISAKKDGIVNMGGLVGVMSAEAPIILDIKKNCISYEGFYTYGGLSGRDMEAIAIGINESADNDYLEYRIGQLEYLAAKLDDAGIGYQSPVGGHGLFIDAKAMFPWIPYNEFPAQTLCIELYKEAGIRACDIGSYMLGNDPDTGKQLQAEFEFSRLAVPRRVYTQAHFDVMADALASIKERAQEIERGYRITWEPPILRHFQARLEPIA